MSSPSRAGARRPVTWLASIAALLLLSGPDFSASSATQAPAPLPVLGRVTDFALLDQTSAPVTRAALAGEPWVANFIFTRCATVCPRLTERMRAIEALARRSDATLRLVTFSVDPEHDAPAVLQAYAEAHHADAPNWKFLTGSEAAIEQVARSFAVAMDGEADPSEPDLGIMHSGHLVLVDASGRIRGYYPSSEDAVAERIVVDLGRLGAS